MGIYEFNQELHDQVLLEDGEAIGLKKGIEIGKDEGIEIGKIGIQIYKEITNGKTDARAIAESVGRSEKEVKDIRKLLEI